jgi:NitT/TauT family transport system substrate-binding protein
VSVLFPFALALLLFLAPPWAAAESIKVGLVKTTSSGHLFIAQERGYFANEDLAVEFVYFEAAQPIAIATVTHDLDFGVSALTAGFYSLAGQGKLRIIAGQSRDEPTYQNLAYLASPHAEDLKSLTDLPGHTIAITQVGSPAQYSLGLLADKYGFDVKSLRLLPLQSFPNIFSAMAGGQVDAGMVAAAPALMAVERGTARLMGWVGDETPWQIGAVFAAVRTTDEKRDLILRFLRAYRMGAQDYHAAFSGIDERRRDGRTATEILDILAKYTGQPVEQLRQGISYVDAEGRLDIKDILHQIAWYKSQNLLKGPIDGEELIDRRYVVPLP